MDKRTWPTGIRPAKGGIQIRIYYQGKEYKTTVKGDAFSKADLAAAVRERERIVNRLDLGLAVYEGDNGKTDLFSNVAQDFLNTADVTYSTLVSYQKALNNFWIPVFGNLLINEIKPSQIKKELKKHPHLTRS